MISFIYKFFTLSIWHFGFDILHNLLQIHVLEYLHCVLIRTLNYFRPIAAHLDSYLFHISLRFLKVRFEVIRMLNRNEIGWRFFFLFDFLLGFFGYVFVLFGSFEPEVFVDFLKSPEVVSGKFEVVKFEFDFGLEHEFGHQDQAFLCYFSLFVIRKHLSFKLGVLTFHYILHFFVY